MHRPGFFPPEPSSGNVIRRLSCFAAPLREDGVIVVAIDVRGVMRVDECCWPVMGMTFLSKSRASLPKLKWFVGDVIYNLRYRLASILAA